MGKKVSQHDKFVRMTTDPVGRLVTQLALPSIASMLITGIYNLVDTFFIGRFLLGFLGVEIAQTVSDLCAFLLAIPLTFKALCGMGK